MNPRSIAIFTWGLDEGAFANLPAALVRGFWDLGIKELYVLYLFEGPGPNITFPEGVRLISLGVQRSMRSPVPLARFLREAQPDVLISMPTIISIPAILGFLLAGQKKTKLVIYQGDTLTSDISIEHKNDLRMQILPWLARLLYPWADGLTTVSEGVLDILKQDHIPIPHNRFAVIPNPVDTEDFLARSYAEPDHPWLQKKQSPVIVSLGRLVKRKNFPLLFKAFKVVQSRVDAKLIIFGEGPERAFLENFIIEQGLENDVSLPGYSANPWSNIAKADVFAMPSVDEAFCLALVEAMACRVPVVSTDAIGGGPRSILEDGKHGNLVPSDDAEALAETICKVLTSQDFQNQLVAAGKQRCEAFKPKAVAQQWLSFLQQL